MKANYTDVIFNSKKYAVPVTSVESQVHKKYGIKVDSTSLTSDMTKIKPLFRLAFIELQSENYIVVPRKTTCCL